ncbi:MAG: MotA/TolQ/ExbB proton channel family protein [Bacteroidales bacterium]|nr:MotA/TolQ/ExbB proton channel family protein [Bacteroidales bacterium]
MLASICTILADVTVGASSAVAEATAEDLTLWNMAVKGGWIMIFLLLFSITAVYIIIERALAIRKAAKEDASFMNEVKNFVKQGEIEKAHIRCQSTDSPIARMIDKGLSRLNKDMRDTREAIENVGKLEVANLEKGLPMLATISSVGPMVGFLGTVLGMITAFYDMANAGGNFSIAMLSNGIYTAMVTTVAGLIVGVIAMLGYNILTAEIGKVVNMMELRTTEFMDLLNEPA